MVSRNTQNAADQVPQTRVSTAPLASVSNRIISCVFFSTLLTALVVSWLSISAIHADVRHRTEQQAKTLLSPRVAELATWRTGAMSALASATSIGTPWHSQLVKAVERPRNTALPGAVLSWSSANTLAQERATGAAGAEALPLPPPELRQQFDEIRFYPASTQSTRTVLPHNDDCFSASVEVFVLEAPVLGRLEACLERELVVSLLHGNTHELQGFRILLVDGAGLIHESAGVRSAARIESSVPSLSDSKNAAPALGAYEDERGNRLLGLPQSIPASDWRLIAESEHTTAFAPAIAITNQIVIVDICVLILFTLVAYRIARALMAPINALSEGAQRIAAGNVDYQIPLPLNRSDELGQLTGAFNAMMAKIRSNHLEIEADRFRLAEKNDELQHANEILSQLSITDGLTKLHNHRYFQDNLTREIKRVSRTRAPLTLILLDIDDFKRLNDTHGHAAGDEVLVSLAAIMNESARESDLIARYGGEEFVVLMPNTDLAGAVHLAEKIRMAIEGTRLIIGENMKPVNVTISVGVALYGGNRRNLFIEADKALYQAKAAGKNCVIIAGSD